MRGLPSDSAFATEMHAEREEEEDWRRELAEKAGREYVPPEQRQRMTLDEFIASGASV